MSNNGCIEIRNLQLSASIGTYASGETAPSSHTLDLTLWIDQSLVLIAEDTMTAVFDYDPLVADIERLATECHYETQERLITRIVIHCAAYMAVESIEIVLRKSPIRNGSGSLGVRTCVDAQKLQQLRDANCARG